MQSNNTVSENNTCANKQIPELVKIEIANMDGVLAHSSPKDGSALEAASELQKLSEILTDRAEELKMKADQVFLGTTNGEAIQNAAALDEVAELLEQKVASIKDKKIELTAHELNSLDGFDR